MTWRRHAERILAAAPYLLAGAGVGIAGLYMTHAGGLTYAMHSFDDDAFYYFRIARNIALGAGSTFDGISPTNGYHPLWMLLLTPIFWLSSDAHTLLVLIKLLCVTCWTISIGLLWRIARRLHMLGTAAVALLLLVPLRELWFRGMETALALTLAFAVVLCCLRDGVFSGRAHRLWPTSLLLALMTLARLDLVYLAAAVAVVRFLSTPTLGLRSHVLGAVTLVAPSMLAIAGLSIIGQQVFGAAVPVAIQAKALGGPHWNFEGIFTYLTAHPVRSPLFGAPPLWAWWVLVILPALLMVPIAASRRWFSSRRDLGGLCAIGVSLVIGNVLQVVGFVTASAWPMWQWYFYYVPLLLAVTLPIMVLVLVRPVQRRFRSATVLASVIVTLLLGAKIAKDATTPREALALPITTTFVTGSVAVAERLERILPPGTVCAMGDRAGSLGFLLNRPLVQTEGLVNSAAYLDALSEGRVNAFLQAKGVEVILYSGGPDGVAGGDPKPAPEIGPGILRIREPKFGRGPRFSILVREEDLLCRLALAQGGATSAWWYRPELNPAEPQPDHR